MSLSSLPHVLVAVAAESGEASGPAVPAWAVGLLTLVILVGMLVGLVAFGGGREHT